MKPKELIEQYKCSFNGNIRAGGYYKLLRYGSVDCVIAYSVNDFGVAFIIKGERKIFCFVSLKNDLDFGGYDYKLSRVDEEYFSSLKDIVVVDKEEFDKYKDTILLKKL